MKKKLLGFFILSQALAFTGGFALDVALAHAEPVNTSASKADAWPTETPRTQLTQLLEQPEKANPVTEPIPEQEPAVKASEPSQPIAPAAPVVPGLTGTEGYALAYGNCVNEPGINNPGYGNPSGWPVTSPTPTIGATAVFTWNHVGVVTGIWSNGDIEVRHQNYWGGQHRFPPSMIRGYR